MNVEKGLGEAFCNPKQESLMRDSPPPPSTFIHRHPPLLFIILSTRQKPHRGVRQSGAYVDEEVRWSVKMNTIVR